jgi:hypothetical protein
MKYVTEVFSPNYAYSSDCQQFFLLLLSLNQFILLFLISLNKVLSLKGIAKKYIHNVIDCIKHQNHKVKNS